MHNNQHLLFATNEQLEVVSHAKSWYVDGTFKLCPHPFSQLFTINVGTNVRNDLQRPYNDLQRPTTTYNDPTTTLQRSTTTYNDATMT